MIVSVGFPLLAIFAVTLRFIAQHGHRKGQPWTLDEALAVLNCVSSILRHLADANTNRLTIFALSDHPGGIRMPHYRWRLRWRHWIRSAVCRRPNYYKVEEGIHEMHFQIYALCFLT
jgi:hypothetical protein